MGLHEETLRAALAERERLVRHERQIAAEATLLMRTMDALQGCDVLEQGIRAVLRLCIDALRVQAAVFLGPDTGTALSALAEGAPPLGGIDWSAFGATLTVPRRVTEIDETPWHEAFAGPAQHYRSLLSVPLAIDREQPSALVLLSVRKAAFSRFDQALLKRIARLLHQAIDRLRLVQRNKVLASMLGEQPQASTEGSGGLDGSFVALSRTLSRIVDWQGQIVDITNALLLCPSASVDRGIDEALARTGLLADSDRVYVFRATRPGYMDNTHEWVGPGIAPMIDRLQDVPIEMLDEWRPDFEANRPVAIRDVAALPEAYALKQTLLMQGICSLLAVPMKREGRIVGFVGYDAVRAHRPFLPMEIQLLQAVANAINVVLDRADAEAAADLARARMQAERDRLKATLTALPDLVLELDRDGRFVAYNEGSPLAPYISPDQFIGRMPEEVLPDALARLMRRIIAAVDAAGHAEGYEYPLEIDGVQRRFIVSAAPRSLNDEPSGYVLVVRDITIRHQQQRQIQRLGKIAELTSNLVIVTDANQRIEWVNPAFEKRTGWRLDDVRGKTPGSVLQTPETDRETLQAVGKALLGGHAVEAELLNRTRTGETFWIRKDIQPLRDAEGRLEGFVAVQTDITELKRSRDRALRERAAALEASTDGIAITRPDGRYVFMNEAHRAMFGIAPDENIECLHWTDLYEPDVAAEFLASGWRDLEADGAWRGELVGRHRDGRPVPQEISLTRQDDGGVLCITRDISERLRAAQVQAGLREDLQLSQRRETIAHLAAGIAHDLNNLVTVVAATATQLEMRGTQDPELAQAVGRIRRAMDAARELVGGLNDLGRPEHRRSTLDLRRTATQAVELLGAARIRTHHITVATPDHPCPVVANPTEVLQVIVNLALNGCDADPEAPPRVTVAVLPGGTMPPDRVPDVGAFDPGLQYAVFTVSDTGKGIDPAIRENLFDRYFTTKGRRGTGLGLSIVANILRNNNAALWVDTDLGHGTRMTIAWPADATARLSVPHVAPLSDDPADLNGLTVLVVDDVADVARVFDEMLEAAGATVVSTTDPAEAERLITENPGVWSALLTDLNMPVIDGVQLAEAARRIDPPVPVVLVTALPDKVTHRDGLFSAVLPKPVEAARLTRAILTASKHEGPAHDPAETNGPATRNGCPKVAETSDPTQADRTPT